MAEKKFGYGKGQIPPPPIVAAARSYSFGLTEANIAREMAPTAPTSLLEQAHELGRAIAPALNAVEDVNKVVVGDKAVYDSAIFFIAMERLQTLATLSVQLRNSYATWGY